VNTLMLNILKRNPVSTAIYNFREALYVRYVYSQWEKAGRPVPPPHLVKQRTVKEYGQRFNLRTLVETGTYMGYMLDSVKGNFDHIYTIEIGRKLYDRAVKKFAAYPHIEILLGDSAEVLPQLLPKLTTPCVFWLDGHDIYSEEITALGLKETPIEQELDHILKHPINGHVILIDDARKFGQGDYPPIKALQDRVVGSAYKTFDIKDDIIRIH
jgi:hypothetical protein